MSQMLPSKSFSSDRPSRGGRLRLDHLDGLRGLAALFVVLHHSWLEIWPLWRQPSHRIQEWTGWLLYGHFAVDVFIVLSGFCLMLPVAHSADGVLRGGAKRFFLSRARRILPPYYFAMVFSWLLIRTLIGTPTGTHWDISLPVTSYALLTHLLLIQNWFPDTEGKLNHAFWSVAVEWQIYFLFPLLVWLGRRTNPLLATVLAVVAAYGVTHLAGPLGSFATVWYLALFALGVLGAQIAHQDRLRPGAAAWTHRLFTAGGWPGWLWLAGGLAASVIWACHRLTWERYVYHFPALDFIAGVATTALLIGLSRPARSRLRTLLSWKPLVALGSFGYSLYLVHAPLIQVVWQYALHPLHLSPALTFAVLVGAGLPAIVGLAYGFHLVCERPFMSKPGQPAPKTERQAEVAAVESPAP